MTGYGKAEAALQAGKLTIELRSLNSKSADISIKSSLLPKDKELLVRDKIASALVRGTIDVFITLEAAPAESALEINADLVKEYYSRISEICKSIPGCSTENLLPAVLRFPNLLENKHSEVIDEAQWPLFEAALDEALVRLDEYRLKEGQALYKDVTSRVRTIMELENEVEAHEAERLQTVKEAIIKAAEEVNLKLDPSRFEQEMVFYLQKLDINEEKVRLRQHCRYFLDTIDSEACPGKKLGFILQEMGREINTTGSKANNAAIQKVVVKMKDELEKIREQSMNIL